MQVEKKTLTTAKLTKEYLSQNEIPQLFECLMTGLMYHRPNDHLTYLEDCLQRIRKHGVNGLRWDMFLGVTKSPLPPIDSAPRENFRPQPLPEIGNFHLRMALDASVILINAGPGFDKNDICKQLCTSFPNYVEINVGHILKERALTEDNNNIQDIINEGGIVPSEFVIETLINELNKHNDGKHFIIGGYPITEEEREHFERFIGLNRVKFMILIDCEREVCERILGQRSPVEKWSNQSHPAITKRLDNYQTKTLPVCKYFDEQNKLKVIDGDMDMGLIMKDIHQIFVKELNETILPHPPSARKDRQTPERELSSPVQRQVTEIAQLSEISPDDVRNKELPEFKLVLLLGGPGSGKSEVASRVCEQHLTWVHVDVNETLRGIAMDPDSHDNGQASCIDNPAFVENWIININVLKDMLKSIPEGTEVVILEGFPKDAEQLNQFNIEIGRPDCVVLLDSEEDVMHARLTQMYAQSQGVEDNELDNDFRVVHYKNYGLSLCRYYDERCKLTIIAADRNLLTVVSDFERIVMEKLKIHNQEIKQDDPIENQTVDDEITNAAAIKIQASIRGHLTRKNLSKKIPANENDKEDENVELIKEEIPEENTEDDNIQENVVDDSGNNDVVAEESTDNVGEDKVQTENIDNDGEEDLDKDIEEDIDKDKEEDIDKDREEDIDKDKEEDIDKDKDEDVVVEDNKNDINEIQEEIKVVIEVPLGENGIRTNSQLELRNAHVVLLLGGPGSGKKTLGSYIVSKFATSFVNIDQIISDAIESGSEESEEFRKYLANDECDETPIYALIRKSLMDSLNVSKVIFLTGFPRTVEQYQRFHIEVCPVSSTIFLDVDEETLKSRQSDPDLPSDYFQQIEAFIKNSPALLETLSFGELFTKVDATQDLAQVTQEVSDIIENFPFMKRDDD